MTDFKDKLVNFDVTMGDGRKKTFYGTACWRKAPGSWHVVGYGFTADVLDEDLRLTKPVKLEARPQI